MKKLVFSATLLMYVLAGMAQNNYSMYQCIPERIDQNRVDDGNNDDLYKSIDIAVVDQDDSKGELEIYFAMPILGLKPFDRASLILNVPDISKAASETGISVYYNDHLLGKCDKIEANSVLEIDLALDPDLNFGRSFKLDIRANGTDETYFYRWHSGWGIMLALYK